MTLLKKRTTNKLKVMTFALSICGLLVATPVTDAQTGNGNQVFPPPSTTQPMSIIEQEGETTPIQNVSTPPFAPKSVQSKLLANKAFDITLAPPTVTEFMRASAALKEGQRGTPTGIVRLLPKQIVVTESQADGGQWITLDNHDRLWSIRLTSDGASSIRLHIEDAHLPLGATLTVFNPDDLTEIHGPFIDLDLRGEAGFWMPTIYSSSAVLEIYFPKNISTQRLSLLIREIAHVSDSAVKVLQTYLPQELSCHIDVNCVPNWLDAASSVARVDYVADGGSWACTGSLLNDLDGETVVPYFLTANHCIGTQAIAETAEFYWLYQTSVCAGDPPDLAKVPRTGGGADYVDGTPFKSDSTLLRIHNSVPGGLRLNGWTTRSPNNSEVFVGIHHPGASYKRISVGTYTGASDTHWHVTWSGGVTEPGSSGSPLFDIDKRVIGQLQGTTLTCTNTTTDYGRFDVTYSKLERWLQIGGTIHVDKSSGGSNLGTPANPFIRVSAVNEIVWNGARIKIKTNHYLESVVLSKQMTIFADGGPVVIGQ